MKKAVTRDELDVRIVAAFEELGNKLLLIAMRTDSTRSQVYYRLRRMGLLKKPLAQGSLDGMVEKVMPLPKKGEIKRYICTSAQNNTFINEPVWDNIVALAEHFDAKILVGTFTYNQNRFGELAVKRGTKKAYETKLWYDKKLHKHFCDKRLRLAHGLVFCGEMNILPTANDPLEGLETYSQRKSAIFPHAKMAMRSVATMKNEGTKLMYTTGTVTQMNYIQKKAGLVGEHHHIYGAVLVEVNDKGNWWVRQLDADKEGRIQDLDVVAHLGKVTTGHPVAAITWGDIHAARLDGEVAKAALDHDGMLATLHPETQFLHDVLEGVAINPHGSQNCHDRYEAFVRGFLNVDAEFKLTANVIRGFTRKSVKTVIVDSNHDGAWIDKWLREHDYRRDPTNAVTFLELQAAKYKAIRDHDSKFNILELALRRFTERDSTIPADVVFLKADDSFKTCGGIIENGMHGHRGPNGSRGTPQNLNKVGRRANTGHTHSAGIWNGLYVAGTSSTLDFGYNSGPSSWTHSHIVTYPNGKRTIITVYAGKWRA